MTMILGTMFNSYSLGVPSWRVRFRSLYLRGRARNARIVVLKLIIHDDNELDKKENIKIDQSYKEAGVIFEERGMMVVERKGKK